MYWLLPFRSKLLSHGFICVVPLAMTSCSLVGIYNESKADITSIFSSENREGTVSSQSQILCASPPSVVQANNSKFYHSEYLKYFSKTETHWLSYHTFLKWILCMKEEFRCEKFRCSAAVLSARNSLFLTNWIVVATHHALPRALKWGVVNFKHGQVALLILLRSKEVLGLLSLKPTEDRKITHILTIFPLWSLQIEHTIVNT